MAVFLWIYGLVSPFAGLVADRISASTGSISINDQSTSYNRILGISVSADLIVYKSK
jgi:hypothetical protein